ncbi:hypothetical protein N9904_00995 [Akkermansiaceae bacterium]|nr:hypothetical protein [Akkermansiaceae bacterium]MDA7519533.1 hypothetical protein [Akkermansiaceae bacterium]MDB0056932.1 hypothetical protein [Akkermansiaceae bacterium]MDB4296549.1 hypothetical protein [Akkermansiaceae bacterium]MDB4729045.1 hypothetical protein [Akkermansiaceae bacterium]
MSRAESIDISLAMQWRSLSGSFIVWSMLISCLIADENLPAEVKVLDLKLVEKMTELDAEYKTELENLVVTYTKAEKFVWAIQAKEAGEALAKGEVPSDNTLPSQVRAVFN